MATLTNFLNSGFNWIRSLPGPIQLAQDAYQQLATFFAATCFGIAAGAIVGNLVALLLQAFSNLLTVANKVAASYVAIVAHVGAHCYVGGVTHNIQYLRGWTGWIVAKNQRFRTFWFKFGFEFLVNAMFTGSIRPEIILAGGITMFLSFFKLVAVREDCNRISNAVISRCALAAIFVWWKGYGLGHAFICLVPAAIGGICLLSQTHELNLVPAV